MISKTKLVLAGMALTAILLFAGVAAASAGPEGVSASGRDVQTKDMVFWLHYDPTSPTVNGQATQLTFNTTQYWATTNRTIDTVKDLKVNFYMVPPLASDLTVNGTVKVGFWCNCTGTTPNFGLTMKISEFNSTGVGTGTDNWTYTYNYPMNFNPTSAPEYYSFDLTNFAHTFAKNSTIHFYLEITSGNDKYKAVYIDTTTNNSRIIFPCRDYMAVTGINTFDYLGNPQNGFQTDVNNTTVVMRSTITDPFGGYDVRWSNLTLTGPSGNAILNNQTMSKTGGTPVSFSNTYETSWNFSGSPPGRYNITVWAVDNNGFYYCFYFMNFNYGYYAVSNTSFFFIGSPKYVNVVALDSMGFPLPDAEVSATILDNVTGRNVTNATGCTNLSMQPGSYVFKVRWSGVPVASQLANITDNLTEAGPLIITCDVFYPVFSAVDSRAIPLVDAAIYVHYPNGTASILPFRTNLSGEISLQQVPRGPYELSVVWGGLEVNRTIILVNGNITYTISCDVFYLKVNLVDPHGLPVPSAQVVVADNSTGIVADSRLSDPNGTVEFRLPRHFYDLGVYWYEAVVNTTRHLPVLADREVDIVCGIFYFTVQALDSKDVPVENALGVVSISSNGKVMDSKLSDGQGMFEIRMPTGSYNISIYWQDVLVFQGAEVPVNADSTFTAYCWVYYLTVTSVDSRGLPIDNAQVQINAVPSGKLFDAKASNAAGNLTSRLPATEISITARWQDVVVNITPSFILEKDDAIVLHCSVHYLTITALDDHGIAIQNAQVRIGFTGTEKLLDVQSTDASGRMVSRLPASLLSITAFWQDILVNYTPSYNLTSDSELQLGCMVYYLEVLTLDSRSVPLEDAFVRVSMVEGRLAESPRSNQSGLVSVRVPVGLVNISVTWANVLVGEVPGHPVNSSHLLIVGCSVYYLDVIVTDSHDVIVTNAQVSFFRMSSGKQMDVRTTGPLGNATFRLPSEIYKITVVWQDQLVSPDTDFRIERDGSLTLKSLIFYLAVKPVDSKGLPLENATVVFNQDFTGNVLDTQITGKDGVVTARLPIGRHTITVSWKDVEVNTTPSYDLTGDASLTVSCRVFYLAARPLDASGLPIAEAEVTVFPAGRSDGSTTLTTDALGNAVFRLPAQDYDMNVAWKGVTVCEQNGYSLVTDSALPLNCRVYYLTVKVADKDGKGLDGVQITVYTVRNSLAYEVAGSAITNGSSRCVFRLPVGEYKVMARLKTTYMLTPIDMTQGRVVDLSDTLSVRLVFDQYPVPIYTTNEFYAALLFTILLLVAISTVYYMYRKFGRKPAPAGTGAAAPSKEDAPLEAATSGDDEQDDEEDDGMDEADEEEETDTGDEEEEEQEEEVDLEDEHGPVDDVKAGPATDKKGPEPVNRPPVNIPPVAPAEPAAHQPVTKLPTQVHEAEAPSKGPGPAAKPEPPKQPEPKAKEGMKADEIDKLLDEL